MKYNYKKLDEQWMFNYRADKLELSRSLGYEYITEMFHKLYEIHRSSKEVGKIIGVKHENVLAVLAYMCVPRVPKGGRKFVKLNEDIVRKFKAGIKPGMVMKDYYVKFIKDNGLDVTPDCMARVYYGRTWASVT